MYCCSVDSHRVLKTIITRPLQNAATATTTTVRPAARVRVGHANATITVRADRSGNRGGRTHSATMLPPRQPAPKAAEMSAHDPAPPRERTLTTGPSTENPAYSRF